MTDILFAAPPRSSNSIEELADALREGFNLQSEPAFPILPFLEFGLDQVVEEMLYHVAPHSEMGAKEGAVDPLARILYVREDVYEAAAQDNGRAWFTIAHEIGHALMHVGTLNRIAPKSTIPVYRDPEWQANRFAAALLMPRRLVTRCRSIQQVAAEFLVSNEAAKLRLRAIGGATIA